MRLWFLQYLLLHAGYLNQICSLFLALISGLLPIRTIVRKVIALPSKFLPAGRTVYAQVGFEQIRGQVSGAAGISLNRKCYKFLLVFTNAGQVSRPRISWEYVSVAKEPNISTIFRIFHLIKRKQNITNIIFGSVDDCQVHIKLKILKKHDPVKMLANVVNVDQLTCEISVFSCQLLQILHGLKIEICWFYRRKSINKRKTHK